MAAWYAAGGFAVVDRNWRRRAGELDLVLRRGPLVVFCEVKARRSNAFGRGVEAVGLAKRRRIRRLAAEWLAGAGLGAVEVRFDVAGVDGTEVTVVEGAF